MLFILLVLPLLQAIWKLSLHLWKFPYILLSNQPSFAQGSTLGPYSILIGYLTPIFIHQVWRFFWKNSYKMFIFVFIDYLPEYLLYLSGVKSESEEKGES